MAAIVSVMVSVAGCSVEPVTFRLTPVTIGGTISGLEGAGLVLTNRGGDDLVVSADGAFQFATPVERGTEYDLAIKSQPTNPTQMCTLANGRGVVGDRGVTDVAVTCTTVAFRIRGTVTGLAGEGMRLRNNGGDELAITEDGPFELATPVRSGAAYDVRVHAQPTVPWQQCEVTGGTGTVGGADVEDIAIACTTSAFTIGGAITGLAGAGLQLQLNGGETIALPADATAFEFPTPVTSGETFAVTVAGNPASPAQTCSVGGGTGTVGGAPVTSVTINCATNSYMIGGTITGLAGAGLVLRNNGGDDLAITANGTFAFATTVLSGGTYSVTVQTQPVMPWQTCTVAAGTGSGTVTNANITTVAIACTTNRYAVGGTVSGLAAGNTVTLRNNSNNEQLAISANGAYAFPTTIASGGAYAVVVASGPSAPISQSCSVTNSTGTVAGAPVTNVNVACTTNSFKVGGTVTGLAVPGVVLVNTPNGETVTLSANGAFSFPTAVASGAAYNAVIQTQAPNQGCSVSGGTGTVGNGPVTSILVTCNGAWSMSQFPMVSPNSFGYGDIALDGNGDLLVVSPNLRTIVRVSRATGQQTTVASGFPTNQDLVGVAYRASNNTIYANTNTSIYAVVAGAPVLLATIPSVHAIAIAPSSFAPFGDFIIVAGGSSQLLHAVNPNGGAVTTIANTGGVVSDLAFAPSGTLYVSGINSIRTVTASGQVTTFTTNQVGTGDGIAIHPEGTALFLADSGSSRILRYTFPLAEVAVVGTVGLNQGTYPSGLVAAPGGVLISVSTSSTLVAFPY